MALLNPGQRAAVHVQIMRELSQVYEPCSTSKSDLLAAVSAADQWAVDNAPSYNTALPVAARNSLTAAQKARLLAAVITARFTQGA